tara:strand:- start:36569 stop:37867 length:1299 start_codon:yes stop_codon:yes gene_type:complete
MSYNSKGKNRKLLRLINNFISVLIISAVFEPLITQQAKKRTVDLAKESKIPIVTELISRRLVDADKLNILIDALEDPSGVELEMLKGIREGIEGRTNIKPPTNWEVVYKKLKNKQNTSQAAIDIAQQFGSAEAAIEMFEVLKDKKQPIELRKSALNSLALKQADILLPEIPDLLNDPKIRKEAIRATASYNSAMIGELLIDNYSDYDTSEKLEIVQSMASRVLYGRLLTQAIKDGVIPKKEVPAYTARQLSRVVGNRFNRVWGPLSKETTESLIAMDKYKNLLKPQNVGTGDPHRGRWVYDGLCGACHVMHGNGGILGPELTGANRTDLDYLLNNIMNPSGIIQDDYKMVMVATKDGRTYAGNIANENDQTLTLRVVGQDPVVLSKSEIMSTDISDLSMMPEGMLDDLESSDIIDLFSYLMLSTSQVKPLEE